MKEIFSGIAFVAVVISIIAAAIYGNYRFDIWKQQQYRSSEQYQLERIANALEKLVENNNVKPR